MAQQEKYRPSTLCPNNWFASSRDGNIADVPSERGIVGRAPPQPHGSPETIHTRRTAGLLHRCGRARNQWTVVEVLPVLRSDEVVNDPCQFLELAVPARPIGDWHSASAAPPKGFQVRARTSSLMVERRLRNINT